MTLALNSSEKSRVGLRIAGAALALGVFAFTATPSSADEPKPTAPLKVRLTQIHSDKGRTGCFLYTGPRGFPIDASAAVQQRWAKIDHGTSECTFAPIEKGVYAVACFHDENGNGKLDKNFFGIPSEGSIVSNEAKGSFGPPKWDQAKFQFSGKPTQLTLRMRY